MGKKDKFWFSLTVEGRDLISFFVTRTKNGYIFGVNKKEIPDIHLTIFSKDGKIRTHITDSTMEINHVWSQQVIPEIPIKKIVNRIKRWIKNHHRNQKAWVMTGELKKRFLEFMKEYNELLDSGKAKIPEILWLAEIVPDFENPKRWKKIRIIELLEKPWEPAYIEEKGIIKHIIPLNSSKMLSFSERQFSNLLNLLLKVFGFDEYFNYLKNKAKEMKIKLISFANEK